MNETRAPTDEKIRKQVLIDYHNGIKPKALSEKTGISINTIKSWIKREKSKQIKNIQDAPQKEKSAPIKRKKGAPLGNKNAEGAGAPKRNQNAVKHGFFSKYMPEETYSIMQEIESKNPLDILWENIQIAYAAIIRAQQIAYVRDKKDNTIIKSGYKDGNVIGEDYLVQTAIDKQSKFMQAQARAQSELRSLIKNYDEMLHNNWELATDEQKARISKIKAETEYRIITVIQKML